MASQHKSTKYQQKLTLGNRDDQLAVDYASCVPCPAGTVPTHIFSLLVLERYSPKPAESESNLPRPQSCTSEKKIWGPRKGDVTRKTVMSTTVERAKESEERRKLPLKCTLYEARSDVAKNMSGADIITFRRLLHGEYCFFSVLPEDRAEIEYVETSYGTAPKGSLLSYQLSLKRKPENQACGISKKRKPTLSLPSETIALYKRRKEEGYI